MFLSKIGRAMMISNIPHRRWRHDMTTVMTKNRAARKRVIRGAAVSALCAAVFAGLATTPAQAAERWVVLGTVRYTTAAAGADIPATEAKCRRQDGQVVASSVWSGKESGSGRNIYYAFTQCMSKRG
ncbi:hypothetical protein ABZ078_32670 [Streptomyces sp. NPDC006385]|uniref:hypothetical protein n=1 Tax=Streptomyces sp. NPDC006385 TaxID=3156761 RepID=UPI0033B154B0